MVPAVFRNSIAILLTVSVYPLWTNLSMRILYLAQRVPYPPHRGDKIATFNHIRYLARRHEVSVACLADGPEDPANAEGLLPIVKSIDVVALSHRRAQLRALMALAGRSPLTLAYFNEPELRRRVKARLEGRQFDAIVIYSSGMAQFVEDGPDLPRIMVFSDLDSLKWRQYAENMRPPKRWIYDLEARRLLRYERRVAAEFDHSLFCTERELQDSRLLLPGARISCLGNGVDLDYFRPMANAKLTNALVFTGIMDYFPNVDGVVWFGEEILPRIREQVPDVTLTICGARPAPRVKALERLPGVTITGQVPDVRPYLARASVGVIPLRLGRGVQNKLLEAMAMGLPTVATTVASGGINASEGTDLLVADDAESFAASVVRLLTDEQMRANMSRSARSAMERNYHWDVQMSALENILASTSNGRTPRSLAAVS
jgi:sugar transferase (PEP-CTERM/EpsH1 system associated)